jgi:hypothetical protein
MQTEGSVSPARGRSPEIAALHKDTSKAALARTIAPPPKKKPGEDSPGPENLLSIHCYLVVKTEVPGPANPLVEQVVQLDEAAENGMNANPVVGSTAME